MQRGVTARFDDGGMHKPFKRSLIGALAEGIKTGSSWMPKPLGCVIFKSAAPVISP